MSKSPYEIMADKYARSPQAQTFSWYVVWHSMHGFVFATPDYFVMGRHVDSSAPPDWISDCTHLFSAAESDCWHVFAMAGHMHKAWSVLPWALPRIAFERERGGKLELQIMPLVRLRRLTQTAST